MKVIYAQKGKTRAAVDLVLALEKEDPKNVVHLVVPTAAEAARVFRWALGNGLVIRKPISMYDLQGLRSRDTGTTHVVIDGLDRWVRNLCEYKGVAVGGITIDAPSGAEREAHVPAKKGGRDS